MAKTLFLLWRDDQPNSQHRWLVSDVDQVSVVQSGTLSDLTAHMAQFKVSYRVILLLPAQWVLHTKANLPVRGAAAMRMAVPYALEDQFAADVDGMHFALGKRESNGDIAVAAVSAELLETVLAEAKAAGLPVTRVFDAASLLPSDSLLVDSHSALYHSRSGDWAGCDLDTLALLFDADSLPRRVMHTDAARTLVDELLQNIQLDQAPTTVSDTLTCLVEHFDEARTINLLQGDYAVRAEAAKHLKMWRWPMALAAVWLIAVLGLRIAEHAQLRAENDALYAEIQAEFGKALPGKRMTARPKRQIERALAAAGQADVGNSGGLLQIVYATGKALKQAQGVTVVNLDFRKSALDLRVRASDLPTVEPMRDALAKAGFESSIQSTNQREGKVEVRLRVISSSASTAASRSAGPIGDRNA